MFTFICFQNGKVVFPQVLKTSSDINEIQTPFLIKGTKSWYFSLCFFFFFFLNNNQAIKPKALLTWPIHSYITNKDKLKSVLSISSIWVIKMGSLQNTVTWYNTHLAGYIANNAAAFKKLISFLSRSLCVVCRPAMKVCFVRCDHTLITSFGNPCPPD